MYTGDDFLLPYPQRVYPKMLSAKPLRVTNSMPKMITPIPQRATSKWAHRNTIFSATMVAAATALTAPVAAQSHPDVSMSWMASGDSTTPINFSLADAGAWAEQADGSFVFSGSMYSDSWQLSWTTRVDTQTDVLLDSLVAVTNTSSTSQWFTANTLLDSIESDLNQNLLTLASTLTVMNLQFSGEAELGSTSSNPIIIAQVDGIAQSSLFNSIYALTAVGPFAVMSESASTTAITSGLQYSLANASEFSLTAGDTATLHTISTLVTIPGPGGLALLVFSGFMPVGGRRRNKKRHRRMA
jgi:hypothetical protein